MLGLPAPTPFDLRFRLLHIPVRVSAWFWVGAAMLGGAGDAGIRVLAIWLAAVFFSILLHEFGHGLTARAFGYRAEVVLIALGGLCFSEEERQTPNERLAVVMMGPGVQFLLLGALCLYGYAALGITWRGDYVLVHEFLPFLPRPSAPIAILGEMEILGAMHERSPTQFLAYFLLFQINLLWPLLNLLPMLPLDGGKVAQVLLTRADRVHGQRRTHIVSLVTAGGMAAYMASRMNPSAGLRGLFPVLFFGVFALQNYQELQAHHRHYVENGPDDADWWKR